jgi:multiple sugar transport system ATP-binding protein
MTTLSGRILKTVAVVAIVAWSIGPIALGVLTSISTQREVASVPSHWIPRHATTQAYHELLQGSHSRAAGGTVTEAGTFSRSMWNSTQLALITTAVTLVVSTMAAYAFGRLRFRFGGAVLALLVGTMVIPIFVIVISLFQILADAHLIDTKRGLVLAGGGRADRRLPPLAGVRPRRHSADELGHRGGRGDPRPVGLGRVPDPAPAHLDHERQARHGADHRVRRQVHDQLPDPGGGGRARADPAGDRRPAPEQADRRDAGGVVVSGTISLEGVTKHFPGGVVAVDDLSLEVEPGEFLVLVGPSGCGKTTALRMVAGLEPVTAGRILINDRVVTKLPPRDRDIAMVFQNYALYAHMSVRGNMGFGLKMARMSKSEIRRRVDEAAEMLGLVELLDRKPRQLSGGQRQRVAMGRAIVREPAAFLMDEPLSNLDAKLRVEMRGEIIRVQRRIAAPTLYVTHDQTEAMTMGDRVAILRDGVLQQLGTPDEIYDNPVNVFVAGFIGSPSMNLVDVRMDGTGVLFGRTRLELPASAVGARPGLAAYAGRSIVLGIRPEDFRADATGALELTVNRVESLGSELMAYLDGGEPGVEITARLERSSHVQEGSPARLAVGLERLYFFDPESGEAIG